MAAAEATDLDAPRQCPVLQGKSANVRQYVLCSCAEGRPQIRQGVWLAVVRAVISSLDPSSVRSTTCRPVGTDGSDGFEIGIAQPSAPTRNNAWLEIQQQMRE